MDTDYVLELLPDRFLICRCTENPGKAPEGASCWFTATTPDEYSLVCPEQFWPERICERTEGPCLCYRIAGPLDLSLVGILAHFTKIAGDAGISTFAVSTFDTDYIFIHCSETLRIERTWEAAGVTVRILPPWGEAAPTE